MWCWPGSSSSHLFLGCNGRIKSVPNNDVINNYHGIDVPQSGLVLLSMALYTVLVTDNIESTKLL